MNKKGQIMLLGIGFMLALTVILLALALAPAVKERIDTTRGAMDCDNSSISNFDKAGCLVADISMFQFVGGLIFMAGAILTARIIL